ncbi:MAG: hypothetical protein K0Q59_5556 [Paenibacillus sp.]|jgi:hypothetical protein|nr:hypothetical protein [Paenibacillus sp.]
MKITIGLVGPQDTVALVRQVAREWEERLILVPYIYEDVEQVPDIVRDRMNDGIDIWLFSGRISYELGRTVSPEPATLMIRSNGSALMKALFEVVRKYGFPSTFTVDTLTEDEVRETLDELQLEAQPFVHPKRGFVPTAAVVEFHESLYRSGQVQVCITYRRHVYEELVKLGVPSCRIVPTIMSIRETLRLASQKGETNHFRQSQIAALFIHIRNVFHENTSSYDSYRLSLKLQELLLQFAEHISGSLIPTGSGTFSLFSTRGALERNKALPPSQLFEKLRLLTGGTVHFGIGYGLTAFGAEQNAVLALSRTEKNEDGGLVFVDETGAVQQSFANQEALKFQYRADESALLDKLKQAGVTAATYNKVAAVQAQLGKQSVTAADLASWLDMTQRNANRLLAELAQGGLAHIVGEEAPTSKGRPRKLFRLERFNG